ncbi:MAG: type II secretion system F family protein [Candidatus Pacearchaeota archaeon]
MSKTMAVIVGILIIVASIIFLPKMAFLLVGLGIVVAALPFLVSYLVSIRKEKELDSRFLEFMRELSESVRAGTPVGKSVIAISQKDFGSLTPFVKKLANQISFGIPMKTALKNFAQDTKSEVISRTIELVIQAETSGGEIALSLNAAVKSVSEIERLRKERKSQVYGVIVQGYIIFLIFIAIMLFVQLKFLPLISQAMQGSTTTGVTGIGLAFQTTTIKTIEKTFLYLILIQAFFAGLVIGKLSEGSMKYGIKHSVILLTVSYLLVAASKLI